MSMNIRFLAARKDRKISQHQLAAACGCHTPDISRIENAGWIPPAAIRDALARELGLSAEELFAEPETVVAPLVASQDHA